jgi:bifunctional ADP-heptose synthase (sugar kinase/adenylyltransferase)
LAVSRHDAGDTYIGTLCAALMEGKPFSKAAATTSQAAGLHVSGWTGPGETASGHCRRGGLVDTIRVV